MARHKAGVTSSMKSSGKIISEAIETAAS